MFGCSIARRGEHVTVLLFICAVSSALALSSIGSDMERHTPATFETGIEYPFHTCQQNGKLTQLVDGEPEVCKVLALRCESSGNFRCHFPVKSHSNQGNVTFRNLCCGQADFALIPEPHKTFRVQCKAVPDPSLTVFLYLDLENPFHFIHVQALSLYIALQRFGLEWRKFQLILSDAPGKGLRNRFIPVFEALSGTKVKFAHEMPVRFCTGEAIVGFQQTATFPMNWHEALPMGVLPELQAKLAGFRAWMLQKHDIRESTHEHHSLPRLLIPLRLGAATSRRLVNAEAIAAAARTRGWHVTMEDFSSMTYREQLHGMGRASLFLGAHGAAFGLLPFLPESAVSMELQPYAQRPPGDFYYGFANWALASQRTHIVWHNRVNNSTLIHGTKAHPKNWQHIWLSTRDIEFLLDTMYQTWMLPTDLRQPLQYLNSAVE